MTIMLAGLLTPRAAFRRSHAPTVSLWRKRLTSGLSLGTLLIFGSADTAQMEPGKADDTPMDGLEEGAPTPVKVNAGRGFIIPKKQGPRAQPGTSAAGNVSLANSFAALGASDTPNVAAGAEQVPSTPWLDPNPENVSFWVTKMAVNPNEDQLARAPPHFRELAEGRRAKIPFKFLCQPGDSLYTSNGKESSAHGFWVDPAARQEFDERLSKTAKPTGGRGSGAGGGRGGGGGRGTGGGRGAGAGRGQAAPDSRKRKVDPKVGAASDAPSSLQPEAPQGASASPGASVPPWQALERQTLLNTVGFLEKQLAQSYGTSQYMNHMVSAAYEKYGTLHTLHEQGLIINSQLRAELVNAYFSATARDEYILTLKSFLQERAPELLAELPEPSYQPITELRKLAEAEAADASRIVFNFHLPQLQEEIKAAVAAMRADMQVILAQERNNVEMGAALMARARAQAAANMPPPTISSTPSNAPTAATAGAARGGGQ